MAKSNIIPFLYESTTIQGIIKLYTESLRNDYNWENLLHANLLDHYVAITEDGEFATSVQKMITDFFYRTISRYNKVRFEGRKKSLIGAEDKINQQIFRQKNNPDYSAELNDSLAFRLIIAGNTLPELTYDCYRLMDECIEFFSHFGFRPTRAETVFDTEGFDITQFTNLYVPDKSLLSINNIRYVKDYNIHPKLNGYQSLHINFEDLIGRVFEIQIRTSFMDAHANSGLACHSLYKGEKYQDDTLYEKVDISKIDINQINVDNFIKSPYYDGAGILEHRIFLVLSNF